MKQFLIAIFLLLGIGTTHAQIQKVIHQMHPLSDYCQIINLDIENPDLEVYYTSGSRIMIETHVKLKHSNSSIMDFMVKHGRYDLSFEEQKEGREYLIKTKKQLPEIKLKGKKLEEEISYILYVPRTIKQVYKGEEKLLATQD